MKDTTILHIKMSLLVMVSTTQAVKQLRKVFCGSGGALPTLREKKQNIIAVIIVISSELAQFEHGDRNTQYQLHYADCLIQCFWSLRHIRDSKSGHVWHLLL